MKDYKNFLMKVSKIRLSLLLFLLAAGLVASIATVCKKSDGPADQPAFMAEGKRDSSDMDSAPGKPGNMPEAFRPVFDAIVELHKNNWLLSESEKELEDSSDNFENYMAAFGDNIIAKVEKVFNSPKLARSDKQGEAEGNTIVEGKVEKGDTISTILEKASASSVQHYISAAKKIFSLNAFKEGQPYLVHLDPETGKVQRFEYEINTKHKLVVEGDEKASAHVEDISYTMRLDSVSGVIGENLFKAVADIGESPQLALRLVKLFGSEINFSRHLDEKDSFSVLIEKRYRNGEYKGYGRIIAATFINRGKTYEAFLFRDGTGKETYYNAKGQNLNKTLLQSPLSIIRITSRFTQNRFHPILHQSRPHLGVDYGAPAGTPVKAVGDGVVTERGWAGGYGNQLVIKHAAGLESLYSHLSGFGRGMRPGEKVNQGQVIGFVGSTGLSTGPHLDFRLRQNGKFINPAKAINPRGRPVAALNMEAFKKTREKARACLNGEKIIENYSVDSIVPLTVISVKEDLIVDEAETKVRPDRAKIRRWQKSRLSSASKRPKRLPARRRR